jgi:enoyl-CoA hydratase
MSTATAQVIVEVRDGVGVITLNAARRRNALNVSMATELAAACDELDHDRSVGAVVVRGEGGYFCAGADRQVLAAASQDPAGEAIFADLSAIYGSFTRVRDLATPSVAAIRGGAVGAGLNLALATTLRVVGVDAKLTSGFLPLRLHPGGGHLGLLHRVAGFEATAAMALFNQPVSGARAVDLGIAWQAVADDEVDELALAIAREAAADPELSRMIVTSLRHEIGPPAISLAAARDLERAAQMRTQRRQGETAR